MQLLEPVFWLADTVLGLFIFILIASVIMSWLVTFNVINTSNRYVYMLADVLYKITEPPLRRIRRFLPNLGGLDLSPIVLLLAIYFVRRLLFQIALAMGVNPGY